MPIPSSVNVRAAIDGLEQLAAFAKAFEDARTVLHALSEAEKAVAAIDKQIADKRAELAKLHDTELAAVKAEAESHRESIVTGARDQAAKILTEARKERDAIRAETTGMTEKRDKLRREIENIQASVARLTG